MNKRDSLELTSPLTANVQARAADSFIDKYAPEVRNILEAVKTAYDLPWTTVEDADLEKVIEAAGSENPYVQEVVNAIRGARDVDKNSTLNTYISDKLADLTTWITTNESRKGTPATKSIIHSLGPNFVKEAITNTVRNTLSNDKTMAWLAGKMGGDEGTRVSKYFKDKGRLPAYAKLPIRQYVPEGLEEYKDKKTGETKTRRTYKPITDKNFKEWFKDELPWTPAAERTDKETLAGILRERDLEKPIMPGSDMKKLGDLNLAEFIHSRDEEKKQTESDFNARKDLDSALGKIEHGHYDDMGIWREGIPDMEGNYIAKDRYDWGRDQPSGLGQVLSLIKAGFTDPSYIDRNLIESPLQMTGPLTKRKEGRDIEFTVPTYNINTPEGATAWMDVMASRLGPYKDSDNKTVTPLGQGDLPGIGWEDLAFSTDDAPSQTEDPGYYDEDIDLRGGGQISQGLDNLYMNKRDSKQKLNNMMGFQERQYGGGLDDASSDLYMNRRRSNAFADPNANTAFASPISMGGLPTIYRYYGGTLGEFSGIEENMGGSPDNVDLGPGNDTGPDVTAEDARKQAKEDAIYTKYGDAYSNQMSLKDPDDPSKGYLDSYADDFGRKGFLGLFGPTRTRSEVLKENEAALRNDYIRRFGGDVGEKMFNVRMATPEGFQNIQSSSGRFGDFEQSYLDEITRAMLDPESALSRARDKKEQVEYWASRKESDDEDKTIEFDPTLSNVVDKISNKFTNLKDYMGEDFKLADEKTIQDTANEFGLVYQGGESPWIGTGMSLLAPAPIGPLMGLSSLFSALMGEKVMGSLYDPRTGKSLTLHESGKVTAGSLEEDPSYTPDEGNYIEPRKKRKRLEKKKAAPKKEEKKKTTAKKTTSSLKKYTLKKLMKKLI